MGESDDRSDAGGSDICWIETPRPDDPAVKPVYDELLRRGGRHYNLYLAAALRPGPMLAADAHYRAVLHDPSNATPGWLLEMLATQAAYLADCDYAAKNHGWNAVRLCGAGRDGASMLEAIRQGDYRTLFTEKEAALLNHGEKLSCHPEKIRKPDIELLRAVGWTDVEILEATQVIAGFAYWVRYINGLGIALNDEEVGRGDI